MRVYKDLHGEETPGTVCLFNVAENGRKRTKGWKLKPDKLNLEIRPQFLIVRMRNRGNKRSKGANATFSISGGFQSRLGNLVEGALARHK